MCLFPATQLLNVRRRFCDFNLVFRIPCKRKFGDNYVCNMTISKCYGEDSVRLFFYLFITALPSEPLNLNSTARYDSCELEWNTPSDNGGGGLQYSIIGTPDDINISDIINTKITIPNLTPNTEYTFNVSATNSLGLGDPVSVQCSTTGNSKILL